MCRFSLRTKVGARFEVPSKMEWRHAMVDPTQNTAINGYGKDVRVLLTCCSPVVLGCLRLTTPAAWPRLQASLALLQSATTH